jgi:phosphatidylserine/phosphatidylglycerophosphate/cardiolipin synthase-like enzyme
MTRHVRTVLVLATLAVASLVLGSLTMTARATDGTPVPSPSASTSTTPSATPGQPSPSASSTPAIAGRSATTAPPDHYNPPNITLFSHPFRKNYWLRIKTHILRTINSVPAGGQIRIMTWSFSSSDYYRALWAAKSRGVSVQIVLAARNTPDISDWSKLTRLIGTRHAGMDRDKSSWVMKCTYSCRGTGGTMHSKIFLFSQAASTPWITMTGSANLTNFAVTGQWNQTNTVAGNQVIYDQALEIFHQMVADKPAVPQYVEQHTPEYWMYYFPRGRLGPDYDFVMSLLRNTKCTGAVNAGANGHTVIRFAMYAWYENRGRWLAKKVRQLWQQGCNIQIVYGIMGNAIKNELYSPSGRGRIPMRQILLANKAGDPIYYIHDKYIAFSGHLGDDPTTTLALQGSFNFSDLGFRSDENFQRLNGRNQYKAYRTDFDLLWRDPQARAPSPNSFISEVDQRNNRGIPQLGTGPYRYMDKD